MDPAEIIKAAPEILKTVAPIATGVAISFTGVAKKMLGPAADEIAEMWRDQVRLYRYERQLKCVEKAERMAQDAGFTPKAVPIKLLFPLLEGASLEEDETLHDMWAALLANASSPEDSGNVRPGFVAILKQLAPDEAMLLKTIEEITDVHGSSMPPIRAQSKAAVDRAMDRHRFLYAEKLRESFEKRDGEEESTTEYRFETCIQMLGSVGLIETEGSIVLSALGRTFLSACRPPAPKPKR